MLKNCRRRYSSALWISLALCPHFWALPVRDASEDKDEVSCVKTFFLHVPKTGGSSVEAWLAHNLPNYEQDDNVNAGRWESIYRQELEDPYLMPKRVITFHGNSLSWLSISAKIPDLRSRYSQANCTMVTFTCFREPEELRRSAYSFWYHNAKYSTKLARKLIVDNLQTQFVFSSFRGPKRDRFNKTRIVREEHIPDVFRSIDTFDYVGVTSDLSTLLHVISRAVGLSSCVTEPQANRNEDPTYLRETRSAQREYSPEQNSSQSFAKPFKVPPPETVLDHKLWEYVQPLASSLNTFPSLPCSTGNYQPSQRVRPKKELKGVLKGKRKVVRHKAAKRSPRKKTKAGVSTLKSRPRQPTRRVVYPQRPVPFRLAKTRKQDK